MQRLGARGLSGATAGEAGGLQAGVTEGAAQEQAGASGGRVHPDASHQVQLHAAEQSAKEHFAPERKAERDGGEHEAPAEAGRKPRSACTIAPSAVFVMTLLMASASGLGALPYFFVGTLSKEWGALANALACGVMLAASFDLVHEGEPYGASLVLLGMVLGAVRAQLDAALLGRPHRRRRVAVQAQCSSRPASSSWSGLRTSSSRACRGRARGRPCWWWALWRRMRWGKAPAWACRSAASGAGRRREHRCSSRAQNADARAALGSDLAMKACAGCAGDPGDRLA